ncbi:hypothetical protein TNCV_455651 [Trichonephila clavipes]|nr:hypothetical protein TNCV_455651 [Trichonephila clavipes]
MAYFSEKSRKTKSRPRFVFLLFPKNKPFFSSDKLGCFIVQTPHRHRSPHGLPANHSAPAGPLQLRSILHNMPDWIGDSIGYEPLLSLNNLFGRRKKRALPLKGYRVEAPERVGPFSTRRV